VIEAHVAFDRRMFGPDAGASLTVDEFARLVEGVRFVERARAGAPGKTLSPEIESLRTTFGRTLAVNRDLPAGHTIAFDELEGKKPAGQGVPAADYAGVLGRMLVRPKKQWDFLTYEDLK
jgi:N-acetylneuraminate synthase